MKVIQLVKSSVNSVEEHTLKVTNDGEVIFSLHLTGEQLEGIARSIKSGKEDYHLSLTFGD